MIVTTFTWYPPPLPLLDADGLGVELGTDAIRSEASRTVGPLTDALRTLALLTDADVIELTGIVALKFVVVIGVELNVPPTGAM